MGVFALVLLFSATAFAQNEADKIVGIYQVEEDGHQSRVQFTKCANGTYQGQIIWLSQPNNPDGSRRMDLKNPNPELRKVSADRIVVVYGIRYNEKSKSWGGGKVYKPTNGKIYNVECSFDNDKTLRVKGSWGPISLSRYWRKIK